MTNKLESNCTALALSNRKVPTNPYDITSSTSRRLETIKREYSAQTRFYLAFDITNSMGPPIEKVKEHILRIGNDVLGENTPTKKYVEAAVIGVGEHQVGELNLRDKNGNKIINAFHSTMGDYGIHNTPTTDKEKFANQLRTMHIFNAKEINWDVPEAYECFAYDLAQEISLDKKLNPEKKYILWFFGDSYPHGVKGIEKKEKDLGCPRKIDPKKSLVELATEVNEIRFIDCETLGLFRKGTYRLVADRDNTYYHKLSELEKNISKVIAASVKRIQGPTQYTEYLRSLSDSTQKKIAGLIEQK